MTWHPDRDRPGVPPDIAAPFEELAGGGRVGQAGGFPSSGMGTPAPAPPAAPRPSHPPDLFPPPQSTYFRVEGFAAVAGPDPGTELGTGFRIPQSSVGFVREITIGAADMLPSDRLFWRVLIDGAPVPGWELTLAPRTAAFVASSETPEFVRIKVGSASVVSVIAGRTDGNTSQLSVNARGWYFPESVLRTFYGSV